LPVFILNHQEKLKLIESEISDPVLFTQYRQFRFFSFDFYTSFRTILLIIYWIASITLVFKYQHKIKKTFHDFGKSWFIWIKIFLGFELLLFLPFLIFSRSAEPLLGFELLHFFTAVLAFGAGLSLLFFPRILYGLNVEKYIEQKTKEKTDTKDFLTQEKILEIETKLKAVLDQEKKFLKRGYSIHNLALDTGIPGYLLTLFINHHLDCSFSDFINQKRVEEACLFIDSGKYDHLSIHGLAEMAGFNNRNSFTQAFQKFKNISPSLYIRSAKVKNLSKSRQD
jgi:AraC-like DNA-binding protein